jgi:ketosteroid isomerase-like protein
VTGAEELDAAMERYHAAAATFVKGDPRAYKEVFSQTDDVSLANPFNPIARGWAEATETMEGAASLYAEGEVVGFERVAQLVTLELGYVMEIERYRAKIGGSDEVTSVELRVTSVLRPEDGTWKVVHRHADPITTPRPPKSVVPD